MMTEGEGEIEGLCVVDCAGLLEIASTQSSNLQALYLGHLKSGTIAVPAVVWGEFKDLYEDEADFLEPYVTKKIIMKRAYQVGAASIADEINSRFSLAPYDRQTDLYAASICSIEQYTLLTTANQVDDYNLMDCCEVSELSDWLNNQ